MAVSVGIIGVFILLASGVLTPRLARAEGTMADAMCTCQMDPSKPRYCPTVPCFDITNGGRTSGMCGAPGKCLGRTSTGLDGLQQALGLAKQIMDLLKGAGGGGGGAGDAQIPQYNTGCLGAYYQVTSTSTDPCAVYNPTPISNSLGNLQDSLSNSLLNSLNDTPQNTDTSQQTQTPTQTQTTPQPVRPLSTSTLLTGDVRLLTSGATIFANLKQGFTEVAGFFGGSTFSGQSQSVVGQLCTSRPWAGGSLVAKAIPDAFFDGLCRGAGYQPGALPITVVPARQTTFVAVPQPTSTKPTITVTGPVKVDIWAEPASVRLGTRTYIFWSASGVLSCIESGPSFAGNSLSGGASTVPITGPTTFTMECTAPDGSKVGDSVTVNLAL